MLKIKKKKELKYKENINYSFFHLPLRLIYNDSLCYHIPDINIYGKLIDKPHNMIV